MRSVPIEQFFSLLSWNQIQEFMYKFDSEIPYRLSECLSPTYIYLIADGRYPEFCIRVRASYWEDKNGVTCSHLLGVDIFERYIDWTSMMMLDVAIHSAGDDQFETLGYPCDIHGDIARAGHLEVSLN